MNTTTSLEKPLKMPVSEADTDLGKSSALIESGWGDKDEKGCLLC